MARIISLSLIGAALALSASAHTIFQVRHLSVRKKTAVLKIPFFGIIGTVCQWRVARPFDRYSCP